MMNYNQVLVIPLQECECISKIVETEEIDGLSTFGDEIFVNDKENTTITVTYISSSRNDIRYISPPIHRNLEFVKLETLREED